MTEQRFREQELGQRALAWVRRRQEVICDRVEPWEHGTIYRATRYPSYFDFNAVVVEDKPTIGVPELIEVADRALDGLEHRRIDFDHASAAEPLRAQFHAHGFHTTRLVWMHFDGPRPGGAEIPVTEVPYDAVNALRAAWQHEDFPSQVAAPFHAQAREVALALGTRVLAMYEDSHPVAYAALEPGGDEIEISAVYVLPAYRGHGRGTALTQAAMTTADETEHLWICADDEDRPKHLYARLGFRPVATTTEFLRLP